MRCQCKYVSGLGKSMDSNNQSLYSNLFWKFVTLLKRQKEMSIFILKTMFLHMLVKNLFVRLSYRFDPSLNLQLTTGFNPMIHRRFVKRYKKDNLCHMKIFHPFSKIRFCKYKQRLPLNPEKYKNSLILGQLEK